MSETQGIIPSDRAADAHGAYRPLHAGSTILVPAIPVSHNDEQYSSGGHQRLFQMQAAHFWYRGRHRFLMHAVRKWALRDIPEDKNPCIIDLGGGCGGWVKYLSDRTPWPNAELALSDSSVQALELAKPMLSPRITLYQTDLMNLQWNDRWDITFALDVIEHLPEPVAALKQIYAATKPGGLAFITVPALQSFWSYIDELANHQKRYCSSDFGPLADETGFEIVDIRYFMFFLSPLVYFSRIASGPKSKDLEVLRKEQEKHHEIPRLIVNRSLSAIFCAETPIGHWIKFPWGTSLLCVMKKPG